MQTEEDRWTKASFRIYSKTKNIEDICTKVNAKPTKYFSKGDFCIKGDPKSFVREENLWILDSGLSDQENIETHIKRFLALFNENAEGIRELQGECDFDIFCAYSSENGQGGFTLEHETLKELTAYPIALSIDLYPPEKIDDDYL